MKLKFDLKKHEFDIAKLLDHHKHKEKHAHAIYDGS